MKAKAALIAHVKPTIVISYRPDMAIGGAIGNEISSGVAAHLRRL